jgi:hypothetical protein
VPSSPRPPTPFGSRRSSRPPVLLALALLVGPACGSGAEPTQEPATGPARFDAATARAGDRVGELEIVSADLGPSEIGGAYVGTVRFRGEITVRGTPRRIASDHTALCFWVSEGAEHLVPRMRHDDRRVWFCFENEGEAEADLGPHLERETAVTVSDYVTVYAFTDAYDTARFVRLE